MYDTLYNQISEIEAMATSPWALALSLAGILSTVLLIVYMHFSAKNRNKKLSAGWYICAYFFPLITVIVFLNKRKKFPGADMKVCPACGDKYPKVYEVCGRCLAPLPEISEEEKSRNQKIEKITGPAFWVTYVAATVASVVMVVMMLIPLFETFGDIMSDLDNIGGRLAITNEAGDKVFYDKKGNEYKNGDDVVIYGKDGTAYTYTADTVTDEDGWEYEDYFYVSEDGEKYSYQLTYVDENGWFVYDEKEEFDYSEEYYNDGGEEDFYYDETSGEYYYHDGGVVSDEDFLKHSLNEISDYKYYEDPYYDKEGKVYYWAGEASWNEKGELITAKNDPTTK